MIEAMSVLLRIAWARASGSRPPLHVLRRAVELSRADYAVFGPPDDPGPVAGPRLTADEIAMIRRRALRATVTNARANVPAYASLPVNPRRLTVDEFQTLPVTTRAQIVEAPHRYFNRSCDSLTFRQQSSGTTGTGRATLYYSTYELEARALASAAGLISRGMINPTDTVVSFLPLTAMLDVHTLQRVCSQIGATCLVYGVLPVQSALDILLDDCATPGHSSQPSVLVTETTHAVAIAAAARARGLSPDRFGLHHVMCGGELMTSSYRALIQEQLAPAEISYSASEIVPAFANICPNGNYHADEASGYFEILDNDVPGLTDKTGVLTVTPFYPLREGMPFIRYRTGDMARPVERCGCGLSEAAGVFALHGREAFSLGLDDRTITQFEVLTALASVPDVGLPVRFRHELSAGGVCVHIHAPGARRQLADDIGDALRPLLGECRVIIHDRPDFPYFPLRWERHLPDRGGIS